MSYCSKTRDVPRDPSDERRATGNGFSLVEVVTALSILALLSSSVLVVISRCVASAADSTLRMHAFETARENMEKLLASNSVKESAEYGTSDKYPEIEWQTIVETFYEPITNRMWVRAVCSAEYEDTQGQKQTIELTHWLTDVTKEQLLQIMKQQEQQDQQFLADQIIGTIEEAAQYAGVNEETIEQWLNDGMLTTENGSFVKNNLDLYKRTNGKPTDDEKKLQAGSEAELLQLRQHIGPSDGQNLSGQKDWQNEIDPATGLTYGELEQMDFNQIFELIKKRQGKEL
jgi:prepilin-type N-terminal cleavage/methylation domain-containing protein